MRRQHFWTGTVICGALVASILILASTSAKAATVSVHVSIVGAHSWAVMLMAALVFGNGFLIGILSRSWWVLIVSPGLTGLWSLLVILSPSGELTREATIELVMIEGLIPGTFGVIAGVIAGRLILRRFRCAQPDERHDVHAF